MANLLINQGTNSAINFDLSGTVNTQVVGIGYGTVSTLGTLPNVPGGTIGSILGVGALPNIPGGTIGSVIGIGSVSGLSNIPGGTLGLVTRVGNVGTLEVGTINGGTIGSVVGIGSVSGLSNLPGGTLGSVIGIGSVSGLSNLPQGSIQVTTGTVGGKAASGVAISGNPLPVGGTDSGGTVYSFLTDTKGQQYLGGGTVSMLNAGTITTLPNIPGGSIVITTGTIVAHAVTAATVTAGTINTGTVNAGTINLGTVVGKDANTVAQTGNPVAIGGTDSGGTIRTIKVDSGGLQRIGLDSGTITVLPNVPGGSIVQTAGTVNTGTINAGTVTIANVAGLFPANQALGDAMGNPTTTLVGGVALAWDGGQFQRIRGYSNGDGNGADVGFVVNGRNQAWNSASWDMFRTLSGAATNLGTGVLAASPIYKSFSYISAAGTTTIKSGAGVLHTINFGSMLGAGTLYNSAGTSTAIMWAVTTPAPQTFTFDIAFGSLTWAGSGVCNINIVYQ